MNTHHTRVFSIIIAIVLCTSLFCSAQVGEEKENFVMPIEFGQGFMKAADYTHYLLAFSAAPMLSFQMRKMNKWRVGIVINYFVENPGDDVSAGVRIGYRLDKSGELGNMFNYWLYPEFSIMKKQRMLAGLGIAVALNPIEISLHPQYEMKSQKFWFTTKLGFNFPLLLQKKKNDKSNDPFLN